MSVNEKTLLILGVGNPLYGDDGAGCRAVELLRGKTLPPHVSLMDGGTLGTDFLTIAPHYDAVWLLDAVRSGDHPAGTVIHMSVDPARVRNFAAQISMHGLNLAGIFQLADTLHLSLPPVVLWGVTAQHLLKCHGLSPAVEAGVQHLADELIQALAEPTKAYVTR